ncbi:MAG TPA: SDR family oxidoreductase [Chitinophagaceae bacterium]|jgi:3-oxoacyl-[acyl-carrier protein] reductase|nr:SDR family oxidoreductase [Chitinophagaceae bacterium]
MNLSLEGRTAVICGSTQGIGWAIAEELALMGAQCVLLARNEEALREKVNLLDSTLRQLHRYAVADFSDPEAVRRAIASIVAEGPVDILVNNTGGPPAGPIIDAPEEAFLQAFQQHLICNHILVQSVVPGMKEKGFGRIINIVSTSVKIPLKGLGVSNTTRGAVASWAKTLAHELAIHGITVNNVLPGYTETGRLESLVRHNAGRRGITEAELAQEMQQEIPAGRFGTAAEIAAVAAFLASPAAAYVNGTSIPVDGGRTGSI